MRVLSVIACALLVLAAADSPLPEMANELRAAMDSHERRLSEAGTSLDHCQVGLTFAGDGRTIAAAGAAARKLGFEVGDALQALNGEPWEPGEGHDSTFEQAKKGDRISATVLRDDASRTVEGKCPHSARDSARLLDDLVIVMLRDRPEECLGRLQELDREFGASADSLRIRWKCFERAVAKGEWKRAQPGEYASSMRDEYVSWIEGVSADEESIEALRADVAGVVSTLTRAGTPRERDPKVNVEPRTCSVGLSGSRKRYFSTRSARNQEGSSTSKVSARARRR